MDEMDDDPAEDPLERIEALEARCNALESLVALLARVMTDEDVERRAAVLWTLEQMEAQSRATNLHDAAIDTFRTTRRLLTGPEGED